MQALDVTEADLEDVLALNEASVPHVSSADLEQMRWFAANGLEIVRGFRCVDCRRRPVPDMRGQYQAAK
jgi:hypothetical protein